MQSMEDAEQGKVRLFGHRHECLNQEGECLASGGTPNACHSFPESGITVEDKGL